MLTLAFFLKKEGKLIISSQISLEFASTHRKANTFIKILKLHDKWKHKNHIWHASNDKIIPTALLVSLRAFLWFS